MENAVALRQNQVDFGSEGSSPFQLQLCSFPPCHVNLAWGFCSGGHGYSWLSAERGGEELKTVPCKEKAGFAYKGHSKCAKGGI